MKRAFRIGIYVLIDVISVAIAWALSLWLLRYDFLASLSANYGYLIGGVCVVILSNALLGLYSTVFRYAGIRTAIKVGITTGAFFVYSLVVSFFADEFVVGWAVVVTLPFLVLLATSRFVTRLKEFFVEYFRKANQTEEETQRILVVGAGDAGHSLIQELQDNKTSKMKPVCVLDDSDEKIGRGINGVKIVGKISDVAWACKTYHVDKIIIAIPSLDKKQLHDIVVECKKTKLTVMSLPSMYDLADGTVTIEKVKEVSVLDLLGRDQVKVNIDEIIGYIENKVVLVTGGGGSIGSELCRQIASHSPKQLIILDVYENNAYEIEQELKRNLPDLNLLTLIASVRDVGKIDDVFDKYRPQIVFHAAAHKHVPLMETSPNEAVKNNVCGTYNVADAAGRFGADKFVLISTDKAVNPTNIMGASKRICEMIVQTINKKYITKFV